MVGREPRRLVALGVLLLVVAAPNGCSSAGGGAATCGPITRETLDPNFLVHVLPGATGLRYRTDPPTSGAHQPSPRLARVQHRPLPRPVQVGLLEGGEVLVQYRGLSGPDVDRLRRMAGGHVVVAPNPGLLHTGVVATAWIYKQTCTAIDEAALAKFVSERSGKGPGTP